MSFVHSDSPLAVVFRHGRRVVAAAMLTSLAAVAMAQDKPLKVATATSPATRGLEIAAQQAKKQGLNVEIIEFSDWRTPNSAVASGEVDVNHFQHKPFLEQSNKAGGYTLQPIAGGYTTTVGLYSKKLTSLAQIKTGAKVAIAQDPINTARSLLTLQEAGLLKLKNGGSTTSTVEDITDNPRKLQIVQIDGPAIARSFDDLDAAVTYATFAKIAGLDVHKPIYREKDNSAYSFVWATKPERANDPRILKFIAIYQNSPEVKAAVREAFDGLVDFPWEKAQKNAQAASQTTASAK
ncbi:MAG TPA: MetQ/NlpA family ABC transporter substrate-binding protein [Burkholderiaceae bacterium]